MRERRRGTGQRNQDQFALARYWATQDQDPDGFAIRMFDGKGRGVVTEIPRKKGDFLLIYDGEKITGKDGEEREKKTSSCFRYFFKYNSRTYCVDATKESGRLGRLINHGEMCERNSKMLRLSHNGEHILALICTRPISKGEEILYDYGIDNLPWKSTSVKCGENRQGPVILLTGIHDNHVKQTVDRFLNLTNGRYAKNTDEMSHVVCQGDDKKFVDGLTLKMLHGLLNNVYIVDISWITESVKKGQQMDENHYKIKGQSDFGKWDRVRRRKLCFTCELVSEFEDIGKDEMVSLITKAGGRMTNDDGSTFHVRIGKPTEYADKQTTDKQWLFDSIAMGKLLPIEPYENAVAPAESRMNDVTTEMDYETELDAVAPAESRMNDVTTEMDYETELDAVAPAESRMNDVTTEMDYETELDAVAPAESRMNDVTTEMDYETELDAVAPAESRMNDVTTEMDYETELDAVAPAESRMNDVTTEMDYETELVPELEDDDYVPEEEDSDSDSYEGPVPDSSSDEGESDSLSLPIPVAPETTKTILVQSCTKICGKRQAKRHCCLFCNNYYSKMARHMEQVHANEPRVARVLCLKKKSKERKNEWAVLLREGDFSHNYNVISKEQGVLLPKYRSRDGESRPAEKYLPCEFCKAFVIKSSLYKHQKTCYQFKNKELFGSTTENSRQLLPLKNPNQFQINVLDRMREDSVTRVVKQDSLILQYGQRLYDKVGSQQQNWHYVSQKMKELARFLMTLRDINSDIKSLSQCFCPQKFDNVITAVQHVAGYDIKENAFATPSLALKLGYSLQKCCCILRNSATRNENQPLKTKATEFLELYKDEWAERISVHALATMSSAKYNKPQMLPLVEDVVLLHKYLDKESKVSKDLDIESRYLELAKICLCQIILFNRKRSGEAQRLKLTDLNNGIKEGKASMESEVKKSLTSFEQELCETHKRIETRGKKGRKVSLILTDKMERNLKMLVDMRKQLHIENDYLFGKPRSIFPIRGCDAMREMAQRSGVKHPARITSTRLRMQLATLSQVLGLTPSNQDLLAKFMGHDIRVHRNIYQLHETTLELAKVTKVLHAINTGRLSAHAGKDLDSMMADPSGLLEDEEDDDDYDDEDEDNVEDEAATNTEDEEAPHREHKQKKNEELAKSVKKTRMTSPRTWTEKEKRAVNSHMSEFFVKRRIPGKLACETVLRKEPALKSRSWQQIKHFVRNKIKKVEKNTQIQTGLTNPKR